MGRSRDEWVKLGKKRILSILKMYRISYKRHLEIKISESGPRNQRVQPLLLSDSLAELLAEKAVVHVETFKSHHIVALPEFGKKSGDHSKLNGFKNSIDLFNKCSASEHLCGLQLEKLLFDAALSANYHVIGTGPIYNSSQQLSKPKAAEVIYYNGNKVYKGETGQGLDLFLIDAETSIPIGIEAKNIREWIYPSSMHIWRMIARACTLNCLPVFVARKIPFITIAGLFKHVGILGFQTHNQYFHPGVREFSNYEFKDKIIEKTRLGFHDIRIPKKNEIPKDFIQFFQKTIPENIETYFERFQNHLELLQKYSIDYKLAEDVHSGYNRQRLYEQFKVEAGLKEPDELDTIDFTY